MKALGIIVVSVILGSAVLYAEEGVSYETIVIYATKDAMLRSSRPSYNFDGKKEAIRGYGYGVKKTIRGGKITYPVMMLGENTTVVAPHDALIVGGFDLVPILQRLDPVPKPVMSRIVSVKLRLFVNYASRSLDKMGVLVFRCTSDWNESRITYNDVFKTFPPEEYGAHISRKHHFHDWITHVSNNTISVTSNRDTIGKEIPFTKAFKIFGDSDDRIYGFVACFADWDDPAYTAKDEKGNIEATGDVELATTEWPAWDGKVTSGFTGKWLTMKNNIKGKKEYIPHIIVKMESRPNPVYEDYLKALEGNSQAEDGRPEGLGPEEI
jgi:hypothetical protein